MVSLKKILFLYVLFLLMFSPSAAIGKEIEDRKWIEVSTPNFRVHSLLSERKTVEIAEFLEMSRLIAAIVTGTRPVESPVATKIYTIGSSESFRSFGLSPDVGGIFRSGLRYNTIVVRSSGNGDESATMMHEYVHFLLRNQGRANFPMWVHEGLAMYLSTAEIDDGLVTIGSTPNGFMNVFDGPFYYRTGTDWVLLREVLERQGENWNGTRSYLFYAESWALIHFLQNRDDATETFGIQLQAYVDLLDAGSASVEAFEEAFHLEIENLDKKVQTYIGRKMIPGFRFELDSVLKNIEPKTRSVSREEISLGLGQFALTSNELNDAQRWFTIAAEKEKYRAQAEAGLGDVQKFQDNFEDALPHFERAIELAPDDAYCQLDIAEYWHDFAIAAEEISIQAEYLAKAREHYRIAWRLDDSMPETYAMYGESFLIGEQDFDKAVGMLEQAERLLPSSIDIRINLAEAYLGADRPEEAAIAARSVIAWSHGESDATAKANEILDALDPKLASSTSTEVENEDNE